MAVLVSVLLQLLAPGAFGQAVDDSTRNAARNLAHDAKTSFDRGDYENARDLFHRAYALVPAPTLALYEARALAHLRRFVEAEEAYVRAVRTSLDSQSPEAFRKAAQEAESDLAALRPRIPKVTIRVRGPGAGDPELTVKLDGNILKTAILGVAAPINPGDHLLTAAAPGGQGVEVKFSIAENERKQIELDVPGGAPTPATATPKGGTSLSGPSATTSDGGTTSDGDNAKPASSFQKHAAYVAGGIGVAGLGTGIVAGLMASARYTAAEKDCPGHVCPPGTQGWDTVQAFRSLRTVSTIGYIAGGIGLAGGATLFFTAPSSTKARASSVNLWLSGSSAGIGGAF